MAWEIDRKDFSVRLINEFGQYAIGDSQESLEHALERAYEDAKQLKPPVYRTYAAPSVQLPKSIDSFI